jgi:methylmalonyl-CoA mutase
MIDHDFTIRDEFPPVNYDQWRELAEATLKGAPFEKKLVRQTYEGIELQPVYSQEDRLSEGDVSGFPGVPPYIRGSNALGAIKSGWDFRQEHRNPLLHSVNEDILLDLEGGVTSLLLVLDRAARQGLDPDEEEAKNLAGVDGIMAYNLDDLERVLAGVHLPRVCISLESGAAFLPAASILAALWQREQLAPDELRGAFNADPLAAISREGYLPLPLEAALTQMSDLAAWTSKNYPHVTAACVNTSPYHNAGATAAQDLAFGMATALEYLRAMTSSGMEIDAAAKQILFRTSLGTHHFLAIAKLRAGRLLWSRVVEACGGSEEAGAMKVHARMSDRVITKHDPYVNLLRNTVSVFTAMVGGADAITSVPFDDAYGPSSKLGRRVARNTGLILQEEAHLDRVIDPAGGSWFIEKLTDEVALKAWGTLQEIERQGGMIRALESGWVAEQIDAVYEARAKDLATRKEGITGVSEFPDLEQQEIDHLPPDLQELHDSAQLRIKRQRKSIALLESLSSGDDLTSATIAAAREGATLGQLAGALGFKVAKTAIAAMETRRFAEPYEQLRDACQVWQTAHGRRPVIFLANLGPIAQHTARAIYAKNFFEAGGFEVITNQGFQDANAAAQAFSQSGAKIVVLCSSDKLYPDFVPQISPLLKAAGAHSVILAGKPGSYEAEWRSAGVDRFIYISCDVLATLRALLEKEKVLTP